MGNPFQMYLYIHEAIVREAGELEEAARDMDPDSHEETATLQKRIAWYHTMMKAHEAAEENFMFPALEKRYQLVAAAYEFDHDHFGPSYFDEIVAALGRLKRDGLPAVKYLYRQTVGLNESLKLHIAKENELLVPIILREFDQSEIGTMAAQMAGSFEPQLMAQTVAWVYRGQSRDDREGTIRFLMMALPPEAFARIGRMICELDTPDEWQLMIQRVPDLAAKIAPE